MNKRLGVALSPPAEPGKLDTGLRFTDILFGFVIRELFLRLQNWNHLPGYVRWQLVVGTTLVLGSWIGFRRSTSRTTYEVKFLNLPLFRFLADQGMIILYFRIAVLTNQDGTHLLASGSLVRSTSLLLFYVFALYVIWDGLGVWMAKAKNRGDPAKNGSFKYPKLDPTHTDPAAQMTTEKQTPNWAGLVISLVTVAAFAVLRWVAICHSTPSASKADWLFMTAFLILLAYRIAKEVRSSWQSL